MIIEYFNNTVDKIWNWERFPLITSKAKNVEAEMSKLKMSKIKMSKIKMSKGNNVETEKVES